SRNHPASRSLVKSTDRYVVAGAVALAALYFYAIELIPTLSIGDPMGPKAVPRMLGVALLISAALLVVEMRLARRKSDAAVLPPLPPLPPEATPPELAEPPTEPAHFAVIGAVVVWTGLYFLVFEPLGYAIATSAYLLALTAYFNRGRWLANVSTSVLFSFTSYLLFTRVFGAQLAAGVLPF
ncbi:MAG: tripartite tricarboxylate transporter TctB family protein, partial [Burkholderiaceae bacterium]